MSASQAETPSDPPPDAETRLTEVRYEHTSNFASVLGRLNATLLISTYQAGKLVVVGTHRGEVRFSFHNFEQAMGVAVRPDLKRIAVGTRRLVWTLRSAPSLGPRIEPAGLHDACYLTRQAHLTGEIHGHEMAYSGPGDRSELWIVNTLFSCLCSLDDEHSFVPRWRPPFISSLASEDRCHLNGLAMHEGKPRFVTAMAESDTAAGWRPTKATSGILIDVPSGAVLARGFAMPHSPRIFENRLFVLDSGKGSLVTVEPTNGKVEEIARFDGYTRGLALHGPLAFVGLSKIRETAVFSGIPIAERRGSLKCGVGVVDWRTGQAVARLEFHSGVDEIFDVQVLPGIRFPAVAGPNQVADGTPPIWLAPAGPN